MRTVVQRWAMLLLLILVVPFVAACGTGTTNTSPTTAAGLPTTDAGIGATTGTGTGTDATTGTGTGTDATSGTGTDATSGAGTGTDATSGTGTGTDATSGAGTGTDTGMLPEVDPAAVTGDIVIAGSSTVYPLTLRMAELFEEEGYNGQITIDSIGSGGGFERFCEAAETDIANASRAINDEERAACEANGRPAIEFRVGTDALAVVVNPELQVDELTLDQLAQIFTGQVTNWNEIDPAAGDIPITLYSPGADSGTYDFFVEEVLGDDEAGIQGAPGIQFSEDDNVLVRGVEGSPGGIGYFGYAYYLENQGSLKILNIDGVEPTAETAEGGEYPLARPLFIYSAAEVIQEKPQVGEFINYYLTYVSDEINGVGYFPASEQAIESSKQELMSVLGS